MRTQKIIQNLQRKLEIGKIIRKDNQIKKYFQVHDNALENQIYHTRDGIADFARKNNVCIDIYEAKHLPEAKETVSPIIEDRFSSKINVVVTNLKNKQQTNRILDATDKAEPIPYTENLFLRSLYRNISEMTNQITGTQKK